MFYVREMVDVDVDVVSTGDVDRIYVRYPWQRYGNHLSGGGH